MFRVVLLCILSGLLTCIEGQSQTSISSGASTYTYYHPSKDKEAWQRLNLWLSATFLNVAKEGQLNLDSALSIASRSLGLSMFTILAEDINDPGLFEESKWVHRCEPRSGLRLLSQSSGKKCLQLLVLLGSYYAFQPDSYYRYRDSVEYFLNMAVTESKSLNEERLGRQALCVLGKMYIHANDNKGDSVYKLLIDQCRKAGDKETEVRTIVYRGIYTPPTPATFQTKINDLQKAADLYRGIGNVEGEINVLVDLGYMLAIAGQLQGANETLFKALELAETINYPYLHYITIALSSITNFQGKFGEPLRYTLQSIKVAENCRDSIGWGYFYSTLALLREFEGRVKDRNDISQKALNRFIIERNPAAYNELVNIVETMEGKGRSKEAMNLALDISKKISAPVTFTEQYYYHRVFAICYINLGKLDSAEVHIKKMDSVESKAEAIRGPLRRSTIDVMYAQIYFKRKEYQKAKENFEKHFTNPSYAMRSLPDDLLIYRWLIIIDSVLGDNESGIYHYKKYTALLDSSFQVTKLRQAEELQVMYQTEEKERQIASLTRQAQLEKDNAEQAALVKKLAIAGIIAAGIIAVLLYWQNRQKQKNNKVITANNKEITLKNEQLQLLLADKEWLLKEIHHRVKNNLQIVISLLNSQSAYIDNDAAIIALQDSRHRLHAIALIHQKLYLAENISRIAMPTYINELVNYLHDSFDTGDQIVFEQSVETISLDVSQAIPLGLIINESIVNAIKYAFPDKGKGIVSIRLQHEAKSDLLLGISDNGIGLPAEFDIKEQDSLGLDLMKGLTKQLNGSFTIESNNGVHITVRFSTLKR